MDFRDTSIMTQVAFKGAIDLCRDIDVTTQEGQAEFVQAFSFLTDCLVEGVRGQAAPEQQAAEVIRGNFPGTTTVQQNTSGNTSGTYSQPQPATQPQPQQPQPGLTVRKQTAAVPDWLYEQATAAHETEVWDNRADIPPGSNRPWFRAVNVMDKTGKPLGFWPPRA